MAATATVSARGEERLRSGHPWIYRADVTDARATAGDVVLVRGARGRPLGRAFFSDRSQIVLRMIAYDGPDADMDVADLIRARVQNAIAFRQSLAIDATAYRLIHGEGDLLPSLIVDRYGDCLVVQTLSQGMNRLLPDITTMLMELESPRGILARNDPRARVLEGLEQRVEVLAGDVPETVTVNETGIEYDVDLRRGQKTGLFLDQRENRAAGAQYARGRLLDCFTYNGGFALVLGTASPWMRASATCSTNCADWTGSVSDSTRSCSIHPLSRRTRPPFPTPAPGTRKSTCGRSSCSMPAARSSPAAARTTSARICLRKWSTTPRWMRRRTYP